MNGPAAARDASPFARTVLGDVPIAELGITYAHEHLVIDSPSRPVELVAEFDLADVHAMATELADAAALGLHTAVDAMPIDAGRNVLKLAELSRRSGVNIVAPTGFHHARYYGAAHWSERASEDELADLFVADIEEGVDERDYSGPIVRRTAHRAGVIKVAGSEGGPSPRDQRMLAAAASAQRRTGAPILTHAEHGTGALEQVRLLADLGVDPGRVAVSHVDKVVDRSYHRELLSTGAFGEYDQAFRWGAADNGTMTLLDWMIADGLGGNVLLGMDAARRRYYRAYGGEPGLRYLLGPFSTALEDHGIDADARRALFVDNPARFLAFDAPGRR